MPGSKTISIDESPGSDAERDRVEERHAVEQVLLERDGDQLLDLGRGEPEGLCLDLDRRGRELREDVLRHAAELHDAQGHQQRREERT